MYIMCVLYMYGMYVVVMQSSCIYCIYSFLCILNSMCIICTYIDFGITCYYIYMIMFILVNYINIHTVSYRIHTCKCI